MHFDINQAMQIMQKDKKKATAGMQYVLLQKIGKGVIQQLLFTDLETILQQY
jgi:3-dehydroquinate synthase